MKNELIFKMFLTAGIFLFSSSHGKELESEETLGKSFYAISSLSYYLDESPKNYHSFDFDDINYLWTVAGAYSPSSGDVEVAKKIYEEALVQNDLESSKELLKQSYSLLNDIWSRLDSTILSTGFKDDVNSPEVADDTSYNLQNNLEQSCKKLLWGSKNNFSEKIKPYLMPSNHPSKRTLDSIFKKSRVISDMESLNNAGFITVSIRPYSYAIIAKHPLMPGYLQKLYLDSETRKKNGKAGWEWLVQRCKGADNVRNLIKKKNLQHFSVPDKWIYLLPKLGKNKKVGEPIILVVTDMDLVSQEESTEMWKTGVTKEQLDELYVILSHGFASSHIGWNIPYSKSGKFTCIDTEHPKRTPNYKEVELYLSDEMKEYWKQLVKTGGNYKGS